MQGKGNELTPKSSGIREVMKFYNGESKKGCEQTEGQTEGR